MAIASILELFFVGIARPWNVRKRCHFLNLSQIILTLQFRHPLCSSPSDKENSQYRRRKQDISHNFEEKEDTPLSLQGRAASWTCPSHTHRDRTAIFVRNILIPSWIKSPCKLLERRSSQHWRRWRWSAESWRSSRPAPCWSCRTTPGRVRWWSKSRRGRPDEKRDDYKHFTIFFSKHLIFLVDIS